MAKVRLRPTNASPTAWRPAPLILPVKLFLLLRPVDNPSGTIYGTLVGSAVLAAEGGKHEGAGEIAFIVLATLLIYWFAHGYSDMLEARAERPSLDGRPHALRDLRHALGAEWSIVGGSLALVAVLLLADLLGAGVNLAVNVALWFAVVELLIWGLVAAYSAQVRGWAMIGYGVGTAVLGVIITSLKILLH